MTAVRIFSVDFLKTSHNETEPLPNDNPGFAPTWDIIVLMIMGLVLVMEVPLLFHIPKVYKMTTGPSHD